MPFVLSPLSLLSLLNYAVVNETGLLRPAYCLSRAELTGVLHAVFFLAETKKPASGHQAETGYRPVSGKN
jgi:hypothetical protein